MLGLIAAKLPLLAKASMIGAFLFFTAAMTGMPVHDVWFDFVLFMVFSSIVGGMPEPDTGLSLPRFFYTWAYRSGHLMVSSATAYFLHQKKWDAISDREK